MLKLLVFDWDGTLADSVGKILACKQWLASQYGLAPPSETTVRAVLGLDFGKAMSLCFPEASQDLLATLKQDFHSLMQQETYQASLFNHAKTVLEELRAQNFKLAIATSKSRKELDQALRMHQLIDTFDVTCCAEEYAAKPHPAMLEHLIKVFKLAPHECLMVGDTTFDIQFALNAQVKTVCVSFGAHSRSLLQTMEPLAIIDDWLEFPSIVEQIKDTACLRPSRVSCRL